MATILSTTLGIAQGQRAPMLVGTSEVAFSDIALSYQASETWTHLIATHDNLGIDAQPYGNRILDLISWTSTPISLNGVADGSIYNAGISARGLFTIIDLPTGGVFIRNTATGALTRADVTAAGVVAAWFSTAFDVTDNGRWALFASAADNLVPGDTSDPDLFLKDFTTGAVTKIASLGPLPVETFSFGQDADITEDGQWVVFKSDAANLTPGDVNARADIFRKNLVTGVVDLVSASAAGAIANNSSFIPKVSEDGRYVTFNSAASNLVAVQNGNTFIKDMLTGAITQPGPAPWLTTTYAIVDGVPVNIGSPGNVTWSFATEFFFVLTDATTGQQLQSATFFNDNGTSIGAQAPQITKMSPDGRYAVFSTIGGPAGFDGYATEFFVIDLRSLAEGDALTPFVAAGRDVILNVGVPGGANVHVTWGDGQASQSGVYSTVARLAHGYAADGTYTAIVTPDGAAADAQTWTVRIDTTFTTETSQTINGDAGRDIVIGASIRDVVNLGDGDDIARTAGGNDLINAGLGNDVIYAGDGNDVVDGGEGDDQINGGAGGDAMTGGAGNDRFTVDSAGDRVYESVGGGTDTVITSINYRLLAASEIEAFLAATGTSALTLEGNGYAQTLTGNAGDNRLKGLVGNDVLLGGLGNDLLYGGGGHVMMTGGAGLDSFVFDIAPNRLTNADTITDFNVVDDRFLIDDAAFAGIGALGALGAARFKIGTAATDADDRIIYNQTTGQLFFDANGNAAGGQILFATVTAGLALTSADFVVY